MIPRVFVLIIAATLTTLAGCSSEESPTPTAINAAQAAQPDQTATLEWAIEGMHCPPCAQAIQASVAQIPGVTAVTVSYEDNRATVQCTPDDDTKTKIAEAISKLGYTATTP